MSVKVDLEIEYEFRASPAILFEFLTNPSHLAQWFADHCDVNGDIYSFFWNGYEETAAIVDIKDNETLKFIWEDDDEKYIKFSLGKADITNATILTIIDHVEEDESDDQRLLWNSQIQRLRTIVGG